MKRHGDESLPRRCLCYRSSRSASKILSWAGFVRPSLGVPVGTILFYWRGVGAVFSLHLADGREVVADVHRVGLASKTLQARWRLQQDLDERRQPVHNLAESLTIGARPIGKAACRHETDI
jgi:hypothetical protein